MPRPNGNRAYTYDEQQAEYERRQQEERDRKIRQEIERYRQQAQASAGSTAPNSSTEDRSWWQKAWDSYLAHEEKADEIQQDLLRKRAGGATYTGQKSWGALNTGAYGTWQGASDMADTLARIGAFNTLTSNNNGFTVNPSGIGSGMSSNGWPVATGLSEEQKASLEEMLNDPHAAHLETPEFFERAKERGEEYEQKAQETLESGDVTPTAKFIGDVTAGAVEQLPHMVFGKAGIAVMALGAYGNAYEDGLDQGLDPNAAAWRALTFASMEAISESMWDITGMHGGSPADEWMMEQVFKRNMLNPVAGALWQVVVSASTEGMEEVVTSVVDNVYDAIALGKYDGMTAAEAMSSIGSDAINDFIMGAATAVLMSGGQMIAENAYEAGARAKAGMGQRTWTRYEQQMWEFWDGCSDADKMKYAGFAAKQTGLSVEDTIAQIEANHEQYNSQVRATEAAQQQIAGSPNIAGVEIVTDAEIQQQDVNQELTAAAVAQDQITDEMAPGLELLQQQMMDENDPAMQALRANVTDENALANQRNITQEERATYQQAYQQTAQDGQTRAVKIGNDNYAVYNDNGVARAVRVYNGTTTQGQRRARMYAGLLGTRYILADSLGYTPNVNGEQQIVNALHTGDDVIIISAQSKAPVTHLFIHELTHGLEKTNAYKELREFVLGNNMENLRKAYGDRFDSVLKWAKEYDGTEATRDAELVARYMEEMMTTESADRIVYEVVQQNRTLAKKIRDGIRRIVNRLRGQNVPEIRKLTALEQTFTRAIQEKQLAEKAMTDGQAAVETVAQYSLNAGTYEYAKRYTGVSEITQTFMDVLPRLAEIQRTLWGGDESIGIKKSRNNIHNMNKILANNTDLWQELYDIQQNLKAAGLQFASDFVTPVQDKVHRWGKDVAAGLLGNTIEYVDVDVELQRTLALQEQGVEVDAKKLKKLRKDVSNGKKQYMFESFKRKLPQMVIDSLSTETRETIRKDFMRAVETAYDRQNGVQDLTPYFKDAFPAMTDKELYAELKAEDKARSKVIRETGISGIAGKTDWNAQAPVRSADKTVGAYNANSCCPMFTIGNNGCYLDACYLTQMGKGANGVNLYTSAMYTGEVLQMSQDNIDRMNKMGGIRVNGVGDMTPENIQQTVDFLRHCAMRGLQVKMISKQEAAFKVVQQTHDMGVDTSGVTVQPSLDNIWVPVKLDDIYGAGVRGTTTTGEVLQGNPAIMESLERGRSRSAAAAYKNIYGRDTMMKDGILYRKYGFTTAQLEELQKKYPDVNVVPRYVVCTAQEIAELALNRYGQVPNAGKIIQTLMHGKVPMGCFSDYGGELLNFGGLRHTIERDPVTGEWEFYGSKIKQNYHMETGEDGKKHKVYDGPAHWVRASKQTDNDPYYKVDQYIKNNYSAEEQDRIYTTLKQQMCCQANDFVDACAGCQSNCAGGCGTASIRPGGFATKDWSLYGKKLNDEYAKFLEGPKYSAGDYNDAMDYADHITMGSLFTGGGLLEKGLAYQLIDKEFGVEYENKIAAVYRNNFGDHIYAGEMEGDVFKFNSKGKNVFYLHASPVCHNFSLANNARGEQQSDIDAAHKTLEHFLNVMPKVCTVENAPAYINSQSARIIVDGLKAAGYDVDIDVYNSADFGGAISRSRCIIRAIKDGTLPSKPAKMASENNWGNVTRDLWGSLPDPPNANAPIAPSMLDAMRNTPGIAELEDEYENGVFHPDRTLFITGTGANHQVTYAYEDELCPSLTTKCGDGRVIFRDGTVKSITPEFVGRIMGLEDYDYSVGSKSTLFTIIGNGIPTQLTRNVMGGLLEQSYMDTHKGKTLYSAGDYQELDREYDAAVKDGDMETAQHLVDEAARANGYTRTMFHGTKADFNTFDPSKAVHGGSGFGFYFGSEDVANDYGKDGRVIKAFVKTDNIGTAKTHKIKAKGVTEFLNRTGISAEDTYQYYGFDTAKDYVRRTHDYRIATDLQYWAQEHRPEIGGAEMLPLLRETLGIDGIERLAFGKELVLWDNTLAKSADPVTYDDNGNVIPLSERFNAENNDIRYSAGEYQELDREGEREQGDYPKEVAHFFDEWKAYVEPDMEESDVVFALRGNIYEQTKKYLEQYGNGDEYDDYLLDLAKKAQDSLDRQPMYSAGDYQTEDAESEVNEMMDDPSDAKEVSDFLNEDGRLDLSKGDTDELIEFAQDLTGNYMRGQLYGYRDLARFLDDISGKDKDLREMLRRVIEIPLENQKRPMVANIKQQLADLHKVQEETGIHAGTRESAAAQWLGEGYRQLEDGSHEDYTLDDLKREFPSKWQDIQKLERYCRQVYDDYVDKINAALESVYPNVEKDMLDKMDLAKAALEKAEENLETAQRTDNQRLIDSCMQKRDDAEKTFENLQKDYISGDYLDNKRLRPKKDYFHHFKDISAKGIGNLKNVLRANESSGLIDPDLVGKSEFTKPKSKWTGFLQRQGNGQFDADAMGGLAKYINEAEYIIAIDPYIAHIRNVVSDLAKATKMTRNANSAIMYLTRFANSLAGKQASTLDRAVVNWNNEAGRKVLNGIIKFNNRVKANSVMGNITSSIKQISNIPNAMTMIKNPVSWGKGIADYLSAMKSGEMSDLIDSSVFMTERYMDTSIDQFKKHTVFDKPKQFAAWMLGFGDEQAARMIWFSAYEDALRKGEENPVRYADDITRRSVAGRGVGEIPYEMQGKMENLLMPYQIEVNNSWQNLVHIVGEKDAGALMRLMIGSHLVNMVTQAISGANALPDVLGIIIDAIKKIAKRDDDEEEESVKDILGEALKSAGGEVMGSITGVGVWAPVLLGMDKDTGENLFGESSPTTYGQGIQGPAMITEALMNLSKYGENADMVSPALKTLMPWGGTQLARTYNAMQDLGWIPEGAYGLPFGEKRDIPGSYSPSGNLRFKIDGLEDTARALLFGSYSTSGGQEYLNSRKAYATADQLAKIVPLAKEAGVNPATFLDVWKNANLDGKGGITQREGATAIGEMDISDDQKLALWRGMNKEDAAVLKIVNAAQDAGLDGWEYLTTYFGADTTGKDGVPDGTVSAAELKDALNQKTDLTDEQRTLLYQSMGFKSNPWA